jgi:membrane associated rhomboid family serine protease
MIPLRDVIPSRRTPIVTIAVIVVNTAVFLHEQALGEAALARFVQAFALVPSALRPETFVTSMFLHGGWLHLLGNMLYLWIFGDNVEDRLGHGRFVVFYVMCGFVAAFAQVAAGPGSHVPIVGASGAIAGVLGAYFVLFPRSRVLTLVPIIFIIRIVEIPAVYLLGFWFLLQILGGLETSGAANVGGVAFWAHVAGFVAGAAGIVAFGGLRRRTDYWGRY